MLKVSAKELETWSDYIVSLCGIRLDQTKGYLLESRLADLAKSTASSSFSELFYKVKADLSGRLSKQVVEKITTRETSFFRDNSPFQLLQNKILPELVDRAVGRGIRTPQIRIWSAACSSGQEIYTIAMTMHELLGDMSKFRIRLLATDISNEAIAHASKAVYAPFEISRGLPANLRQKYFVPEGKDWKVKDEIRAMVSFRQMNLLKDFSAVGSFDIIFCRNVAIYFDEKDKKDMFTRLSRQLDPEGTLIIGSTESITGLCPFFLSKRHLRSIYYQLK